MALETADLPERTRSKVKNQYWDGEGKKRRGMKCLKGFAYTSATEEPDREKSSETHIQEGGIMCGLRGRNLCSTLGQ